MHHSGGNTDSGRGCASAGAGTVVGQTHTNLIFDLVLPFDIKDDPEAVVESLKSAIAEERPHHYCVVTIDRG